MGGADKPVEPDAGVLPRFAYDLRQLRRTAGRRKLADRASYRASTLAEARTNGVEFDTPGRAPQPELVLAAEPEPADAAAEPEPADAAADDPAATGRGGLRAWLPRRYWRYPAAALALLAVAAMNFVLGQRTATDSLRARSAGHPTGTAASVGASDPQIRYGFETAVAPWAPAWNAPNLTVAVDAAVADTGQRSLRLQAASEVAAPPAIGTADVTGLGPGGTVTFRIRYLAGRGQVRPYVQDTDGVIHWPVMTPPALQPQGWTTCSWRVPPVAVRSVGLELDSAGTAGLVVALDTVEW